MSTMQTTSAEIAREALDARKDARVRAAAVRARLRLATDALAAADLLLGVNASIDAVTAGRRP